MAYGNNPSGSATDAVRLLVGDVSTSTAAELLTDNSYTYFINTTPSHYAAAALAANSLAAMYAAEGTEKEVGDLRLKRTEDPEYWSALGRRLDRMASKMTAPYAGGISKSDKSSVKADSDRAEPAFVRNQFDNPNTVTTSVAST